MPVDESSAMLSPMTALNETSFPLVPNSATDASGATGVALSLSTKRFRIQNAGPDDVYWSMVSGVTALAAGNGVLLSSGAESSVFGKEASTPQSLFFVCDTGLTSTVKIIEEK